MQIPPPPPSPPRSGGWSIYTRPDITDRYEILDRVGSGTYSDVYRGRRRADGLIVALKEVHDCQSAYREIEALQVLQGSPNVISLFDYFWRDDDDAVLVLEFLDTDLASVISDARRNRDSGIPSGEVKRWMLQILQGVDACHRNSIVHRDLKPANLLVSAAGVLKLADFGQSRILLPHQTFRPAEDSQNRGPMLQQQRPVNSCSEGSECQTVAQPEPGLVMKQSYLEEDTGEEAESIQDGNASCLATCTTSDMAEYEVDDDRGGDPGAFTSCVGTRWFRAPELLYGSEKYGTEIDLWSLGCIFAELLTLQPLFPGSSDIDQLSRIINVLGDLNEAAWPGCSNLPDYGKMFFSKVENPLGLESCLPNRSVSEVNMVKRLVCYEPQSRATPMELLQDKYLNEEPFPVALNELRVPSSKDTQEDDSPRQWGHGGDLSDSDLDFGGVDVTTTSAGFSIRFS